MVFEKMKNKGVSKAGSLHENNHAGIPWELPEWAPKQLHERFIHAQVNILRYLLQEFDLRDESAHEQIETWSKVFVARHSPPNIRQHFMITKEFKETSIPPEVMLELGILIYAQLIAGLGMTKGLETHFGSEGEKILWGMTFGDVTLR